MKRTILYLLLAGLLQAEPAFVGFLSLPGEGNRFAVTSSPDGEARWLRLDDSVDGYRLSEFRPKDEILVLTKDGSSLLLKLGSHASTQSAQLPDRFPVQVAGAVNKYGKYELKRGARVSDAIAIAGGATRFGRVHQVRLTRVMEDGEYLTFSLNLTSKGAPEENMELQPNDNVLIPEQIF